jgi:predicted  nucleic acid-binding Zn-ribbon protein
MNTQLQVLIALQDILLLIRDAKDPSRRKQYERIGFKISNLDSLEETRQKLEEQLDPAIRNQYGRMKQRYGRVVAPVINSVCHGCFVTIPSAIRGAEDRNKKLYRCENCGMFLYWVEEQPVLR